MAKKVLIIFCFCVVAVSVSYVCMKHIRINYTASMPEGVYWISDIGNAKIKHGDIVGVTLPAKIADFGRKRGYIGPNDNVLVKKVIAAPGDKTRIKKPYIWVNQKRYKIQTYSKDPHGRKLAPINDDSFIANGYFLYGDDSNKSWDSRYFGFLPAKYLRYSAIRIYCY